MKAIRGVELIKLFQYNWMVRNEWFELCKQMPAEQLLRKRTGRAGNIHYTFFHIADVEYSWIRGIQGKPDIPVPFEHYNTLEQVKKLSDAWIREIQGFLDTWSNELENDPVSVSWCHPKVKTLASCISWARVSSLSNKNMIFRISDFGCLFCLG
ncbi:DinB family protein [Paenibacillus sp. GCM10027627]|uniref:DinB family protein n=1 Tax=unclassified Paenibacillus TaxID=185978 RepID=UPI003631FEA9